jgi:ribosome-binding protein aMBF1 (putative translation factor)
MAAARMARNLTQKQLDMLCKFPSNTTNAFEAGRICPTSIQIQSLNRILNIKLERE